MNKRFTKPKPRQIKLTHATVALLRLEVARLSKSGNPEVRRFAAAMRERYPELGKDDNA